MAKSMFLNVSEKELDTIIDNKNDIFSILHSKEHFIYNIIDNKIYKIQKTEEKDIFNQENYILLPIIENNIKIKLHYTHIEIINNISNFNYFPDYIILNKNNIKVDWFIINNHVSYDIKNNMIDKYKKNIYVENYKNTFDNSKDFLKYNLTYLLSMTIEAQFIIMIIMVCSIMSFKLIEFDVPLTNILLYASILLNVFAIIYIYKINKLLCGLLGIDP